MNNDSLISFVFLSPYARRIPDPVHKKTHNTERHIFLCRASSLPLGLPYDPNARRPNTNKRVYKTVEDSLLNLPNSGEPNTFHLKNKGITIVAESVEQQGDDSYVVRLKSGLHGILDGGHTYSLISQHIEARDIPEDQFVQVEVRVGIPDFWIPEIAGGLNTSVQVQNMSLDMLKGAFSWLQNELRDQSYYEQIAWRENDSGEYDARDIISFLLALNVELYPQDKTDCPVVAYSSKSKSLDMFESKGDSFLRMKDMVKDILILWDTISFEAAEIWNKDGAKFGRLKWVEYRDEKTQKPFDFHFINKKGYHRISSPALYPIFSAYRWYVDYDESTLKLKWKIPFEHVLDAWRRDAEQLLKTTQEVSEQLGRNLNAIGKSGNHWSNLHRIVLSNDLLSKVG